MKVLELIVQNKLEAMEAEKLGAHRLELVSAMKEGGLTPSYGTIKQVMESVKIPVQIMVRPHSYHFSYTKDEFNVICEDIHMITELGSNRIVFGAIHKDGTVNEEMLNEIIVKFPTINITFHRAFDEVVSQEAAYHTLLKYKQHVKRILTSGGESNCMKGKDKLAKLVKLSHEQDGPIIMPGSGLSPDNIAYIHETVGAEQYHFGSAVRIESSFANGFSKNAVDQVLNNLL
ncbi:copper homeostasis protein CutC [Sutcliffiella sp. NC1]|uniref:copper homeostasis protein CutC n=1 Tax=Sutcliffiella sp. NC1 TaxID=3004096 RepID=UPI0022DE6AC0|nr:copper homeostasis protein CutC [Sutcliffiella sp. NC1]WBL14670.1 copper homeostasis protein CutC [Sutcliffiella sp. NC1]